MTTTAMHEPTTVRLPALGDIVIHETTRSHPREIALGAYRDHELVGILACEPDELGNGHVVIFVLPQWRGVGIGRELLRCMADRALDAGLSYLSFAYTADNDAASAMVASTGLVIARRIRGGLVKAAIPASTVRPPLVPST